MEESNKNNIIFAIIAIVVVLFLSISSVFVVKSFLNSQSKPADPENHDTTPVKVNTEYKLKGNSLDDFDLYFLKLNDKEENVVYSPLSIKYTLQMLADGSNNNTKSQISSILGEYEAKKYPNSENMSFANAFFIRSSYRPSIKSDYVDLLKDSYNAEVIIDDFASPSNINKWVSDKTFNLVNNLVDDVSGNDFILINALAIDMEWINQIQLTNEKDTRSGTRGGDAYSISYMYEKCNENKFGFDKCHIYVPYYDNNQTSSFNDIENVKISKIGASINKYDIVNVLGEDNIRSEVGKAYQEWLDESEAKGEKFNEDYLPKDVDKYLDKYIEVLDSNYKRISSSTDFMLYDDDNIKSFAKDLKTYNGVTLQYVGIMPKNEDLSDYIKDVDEEKLNSIIKDLKPIELDSFEEGYITTITGYIPLFNFEYELDLMNNLKKLGITDVFDSKKADLSNLTSSNNAYINKACHKSNIDFSNDGIKASAATFFGGAGATGGGFYYDFEVPYKEIDLTFDKPYLFLIRDKDTGEVWFTGKVYEPSISER